jgi:hypothetical protein
MTPMTTDRDKARELLRGRQAGINGAQRGPARPGQHGLYAA